MNKRKTTQDDALKKDTTETLTSYQTPLAGVVLIQKQLGMVVLQELLARIRGVSETDVVFEPKGLSDAYMWNHSAAQLKPDATDKLFLNSRHLFRTCNFLGYHTMGGYYGFFRPDLQEVIELIYDWWKLEHPQVTRVYVRTLPYPDPDDCMRGYLERPRRHAGCTQIWWQPSDASPLPFATWELQKTALEKLFDNVSTNV